MKKGKRIIALFLAVLMIATSDTGVYQAFGMDAANQASEAEEAAGGEGQSSGTVDQEDISGQEQGGAEIRQIRKEDSRKRKYRRRLPNRTILPQAAGQMQRTAMILATRQAL
ncbi:MAG: hypothetical protein ACLTLQ_09935 [[Clostridium] scindens]